MTHEVSLWRCLADRLGIDVVAPSTILVGDQFVTFTALLPQFGAKNGMLVDSDSQKIEDHADDLLKLGYGYSILTLGDDGGDHGDDGDDGDDGVKEMLRDWGWSSLNPPPSWW